MNNINFELIYISVIMHLMFRYYFMKQIRLERCSLKTSHKLQVSSARPFKVLQMIESNNYVIKLSLNFDINSIFDMKDFIIYKIQPIFNAPSETPASYYL
jgi:hypothetical protein